MLTLMFGFAFSKPLIAFAVWAPSVPSPDSAKTIVCLALPEMLFGEAELEPQAAATRPTRALAATGPANRPARRARPSTVPRRATGHLSDVVTGLRPRAQRNPTRPAASYPTAPPGNHIPGGHDCGYGVRRRRGPEKAVSMRVAFSTDDHNECAREVLSYLESVAEVAERSRASASPSE